MPIPPTPRRPLTVGEMHYSRQVFGEEVDYGLPRIFRGYWAGFQPSDTAITPNGNMYYPPNLYRDDFSKNRSDFFLFIHEMTHCWQHQIGMNVMALGLVERQYEYGILKDTDKFKDFPIEQQASIVADYVRITQGVSPILGHGAMSTYRTVIPFLPGLKQLGRPTER